MNYGANRLNSRYNYRAKSYIYRALATHNPYIVSQGLAQASISQTMTFTNTFATLLTNTNVNKEP